MKGRKFSIIAIVFACVLGVSMMGVGIAAAEGQFSWTGTVTVGVTGGTITLDTNTQGWTEGEGNTWGVSLLQGGYTEAVFTITNTYGNLQTVVPSVSYSPNDGHISTAWSYSPVDVAGNGGTAQVTLSIGADDQSSTSGYTITITAEDNNY